MLMQTTRPIGRLVDVPGTGACLFHAIEQNINDTSVAHQLRMEVVGWVKAHWDDNPDIGPLLGAARREVQWNPDENKFELLHLREELADFPGDDRTLVTAATVTLEVRFVSDVLCGDTVGVRAGS